MSGRDLPQSDAVLTIEPVTAAMRAGRPMSPDAVLALVERYRGQEHIRSTDDECPRGIEAAARAWAAVTGAAFGGAR